MLTAASELLVSLSGPGEGHDCRDHANDKNQEAYATADNPSFQQPDILCVLRVHHASDCSQNSTTRLDHAAAEPSAWCIAVFPAELEAVSS